jgi:hypothetical protein
MVPAEPYVRNQFFRIIFEYYSRIPSNIICTNMRLKNVLSEYYLRKYYLIFIQGDFYLNYIC